MDHEKKDPRMIPREKDDKSLSPLGRGADPGSAIEGGPIEGTGIAGQHGHQSSNAKGGPEGLVHRENEDAMQRERDPGR